MTKGSYVLFVSGWMLLVLSGCSSSSRISNGWGRDYEPPALSVNDGADVAQPASEDRTERNQDDDVARKHTSLANSSDRALESLLRKELDGWMGVPHVLGGTSKRGVDCSALVQRVYADALNVVTPRTTEKQLRFGDPVSASSLRSGDLVFFKPSRNYRHVGIYLSAGNFAHASSSQGVMISNLSEAYWRRSYIAARRVIGSNNLISKSVSDTEPLTVPVAEFVAELGAEPIAAPIAEPVSEFVP